MTTLELLTLNFTGLDSNLNSTQVSVQRTDANPSTSSGQALGAPGGTGPRRN